MEKLKTILLIDDDTIACWLNQTLLEKTELVDSVAVLNEGQSAIEYLQRCCSDPVDTAANCPDLILLDLDMPAVSGYDVLEALQNMETCAWLIPQRIMVLSTSINPQDQERASQYHVRDFLVKPLTDTKVKVVLEQFMNLHDGKSTQVLPQESSKYVSHDREPMAREKASKLVNGETNLEQETE